MRVYKLFSNSNEYQSAATIKKKSDFPEDTEKNHYDANEDLKDRISSSIIIATEVTFSE
jgi:hypothetical protein